MQIKVPEPLRRAFRIACWKQVFSLAQLILEQKRGSGCEPHPLFCFVIFGFRTPCECFVSAWNRDVSHLCVPADDHQYLDRQRSDSLIPT